MKRRIGIAADVLMYLLLLTQMLYVFTGNTVHELLGIGFFLSLTVHIVLKRKRLASLLHFKGKKPARLFADITTLLLMLSLVLMAVSSMDVSRFLLPRVRLTGSAALHRYLATAVLTLSVIHGGMHGFLRTKHKVRAGVLIAAGAGASLAVGLALVPYLNRHYRTVSIVRETAIRGETVDTNGKNVLAVYFTRVGNTDFDPNVDAVSGASLMLADGVLTGNTELLADMVQDALHCDVQAITLTGTKYPSGYGETVAVAGQELRQNARPAIESISAEGYDTVILIYPIWWGTIPMPVAAFLEQTDLAGKDIDLLATQGSSGFIDSTEDIRALVPDAAVTEGLSIYCDDIPDVRAQIGDWLRSVFTS